MHKMRTTVVLLAAIVTASAPAFVGDKPRDAEYYSEQSQEVVAEQQGHQGTVPLVGEMLADTEPDSVLEPYSGDGGDDLNRAATKADRVSLDNAERRRNPRPSTPVWMGVFAVGLSLTAVLALRQYANKVVPAGKRRRRD